MNNINTKHQLKRARVRTLLLVMFCYLFYYTGRQNFGFAIPGMVEDLGLTKIQLGWCGAAMLWAYALGQAVNGQLADRFGGRKMMSLGGIISFLLNVIVSFAGGLAGVLVPWTGNGFAQSMGWAPGSRILSNWWDKNNRGKVYGFYVFAAGCSSIITYALAAFFVDYGWRWIFRLPVILMLLGCIVFWFTVRERPAHAGLLELKDDEDDEDSQEEHDNLKWWERYMKGFRCMPFMLGCVAIGFQNMARYGLLIWVPVHFLGDNWKDSDDKWISVALPVGMAFGAVSAGFISDRVFRGDRAKPVILFLSIAAVCAFGMYYLPSSSWFGLPLLFLTGFFVYGPQSAFWALCPDLLGKRLTGTGTGMMNFFAYLFAGLGEPLVGGGIQHTGNTATVFPIVAIACIAGAALMTMVELRMRKERRLGLR